MKKMTRKEFADLCGVSPSYLNNYIRRGKVFVSADKKIDPKLKMNKDFYDARKGEEHAKKGEVPKKKKKEEKKEEPATLPQAVIDRLKRAEELEQEQAMNKYNLDRHAKELDVKQKEQSVELNKIRIQKARGEVVPTELVKVLFKQHFKSVTVSFHQGADNYISMIAKRTGTPKEELAGLRGELIEIINKSVKESIEASKITLEGLVREYSQKRGVGEKK